MKKILIFSTLKSQVIFEDSRTIIQSEPIHPYIGLLWSNLIVENGYSVDYLNTTNHIKSKKNNFFYNYIFLPKYYSTIILHSTSGLGKATLIKIFNWKVNIIFYSLSKINPSGNYLHILLRKIVAFCDIFFSDHIVYGLSQLIKVAPLKWFKKKSTYFPFLTDYDFFQSALNMSKGLNGIYENFILVVGDITRDDEYVYHELSTITIPVIRVTRDLKVINVVDKLLNIQRGDLVLRGISFEELADLYNRAKCCIVASKFDNWQPGGITSIAEALACNGICICNSSGEIEAEFDYLVTTNHVNNPLFYYRYPETGALKNALSDVLKLSDDNISTARKNSNLFAGDLLNFNKSGKKKLNELIRMYFK